jgi:hypothetical protein
VKGGQWRPKIRVECPGSIEVQLISKGIEDVCDSVLEVVCVGNVVVDNQEVESEVGVEVLAGGGLEEVLGGGSELSVDIFVVLLLLLLLLLLELSDVLVGEEVVETD